MIDLDSLSTNAGVLEVNQLDYVSSANGNSMDILPMYCRSLPAMIGKHLKKRVPFPQWNAATSSTTFPAAKKATPWEKLLSQNRLVTD
jgi:hypothetical protein